MAVRTVSFVKGHATHNDFVILVDPDDIDPMDVSTVRWLCDRRGGIGADGILRAVRARHIFDWSGDADLWFMDYRNADGSIAEMCGNGLRLFVRYLLDAGMLSPDDIQIATRAGLRTAWSLPDQQITVSMGAASCGAESTSVLCGGRTYLATPVNVGNPHAVVELDDADELMRLDLTVAPRLDAEVFPDGVNVEFIVAHQDSEIQMRVFERGVGETQSCGTGVIASAASYLRSRGELKGNVTVNVPGGCLAAKITADQAYLTGPAVTTSQGKAFLRTD